MPISTRALMQHIVQADLVISVGGGFWTENSRRALYFHLLQVVCALVAKRRVISLGVSLGPFRSLWRARLTGAILNRTSAVVLREKESFPVAQAMGMDPHKVHLGADMAFGLAPSMAAPQKAADGPHRRFGITAKNWIFPKADDPKAAQVHYEQVLARTIDQLVEHFDAEVLFLPQVIGPETDDDRIVQRRIAGAMRHGNRATVLDSNFSPKELVSLIRDLDFVIATRFHSAIFTMLANVPVVAIAYEHKTTGIMDLLGLGRWVLPIEQVNEAQIVNLCTSIMAERDAVQQHLARAVDAMCQQAYLSAATYASIPAPAQRVLDVKAHQ